MLRVLTKEGRGNVLWEPKNKGLFEKVATTAAFLILFRELNSTLSIPIKLISLLQARSLLLHEER